MNLANLPTEWRWSSLAEIAAQVPNAIVDGPFGSNLKLSDYVDAGVPVLQGKNITDDRFNWFDVRFISEAKATALQRSAVRVGDMLIVKIGSIGYSAVVDSLGGFDRAIIPANLAKVTIDPALIDRGYLHHWMKTRDVKAFLQNSASKTAQPALSLNKIRQLPLPLPPLPEQRRLAAILDQADLLRAKRREALTQLDSLMQAIFIEMFGDPVANPMEWPDTLKLGAVAVIASGVTKGRKIGDVPTRIVPYLAVANVQDKALSLSGVKEIEASEGEIGRYRLLRDDLLLTEGGDPDKLGRGTLWNDELPECIHQNHIFRVRLTSRDVSPLFLNWLVGSARGKKYFLRSAKQTTGIASINMTQLREFPLLLPPLALQQTFTTRIQAVESLKTTERAALAELDALFASLQHRAFAGQLS